MSTSMTFPLGGSYVRSTADGADERPGTFTGTLAAAGTIGNFVSSDVAPRRGLGRFTDSELGTVTTRTGTIRTATATATATMRTATGSIRTATGSLRVRRTA